MKSLGTSFVKYLSVILAGILLTTACKYSEEPNVFEDKNIRLKYPSYLSESSDIYPMPNSLLQASNGYRDVYFILVDHGMKPGEKGFELMYDSLTNQLKRNLKEPNIEARDTTFITANKFKVKEYQVSGILSNAEQDHRFLFVVDVMEAPDGHIYQTAGWLLRNKRHKWLKDLQQAAYSIESR